MDARACEQDLGNPRGIVSSSPQDSVIDVLADEDERLYLELVEQPAQFDETDEEEEDENNNMGVNGNDEDEADRPIKAYDKDNPSMEEGIIFLSMVECRNALVNYCIEGEYDYIIDKSEPRRLTVHCWFKRCKWRFHVSPMKNSTNIQVKVNRPSHSCPSADRQDTMKLCNSKWCADAMLQWVTENPSITPTQLIPKIKNKYNIEVPYMRVFYGKEKTLDKIYGPWTDSFKLLFTFKAEVEKACPESVVDIDHETVQYKVKGKIREKECFKRVFVSFMACWKGFVAGCRPYLAVDANALNGRYRGQLVAACGIDAHNWLFPVAYGVLEAETKESWTWFFEKLHKIIGFPDGLTIHTDASKGLEVAVEHVFSGVHHRECMQHLAANLGKKFKGMIVDDNLWPAALTCCGVKHKKHLTQLYTKAGLKEYMEKPTLLSC